MQWNRVVVVVGVAVLLGCGGKDGMGGSDSGGSGSGEGESGEGGDGDCQNDGFGTVMVELHRAASETSDPFEGTAYIVTFLDYEECLQGFYGADHPEYQQDGVEGAEVFEAWADGCLCDASYDKPVIECTVSAMSQTLNTQGAMDVGFLRVEYAIANDDLEGSNIPFGPLPTDELAGCSGLVQLKQASVQGFDAQKNQIWQIASYDNATAHVGQGASIQIFVERTD